jgi:hypothetical protein
VINEDEETAHVDNATADSGLMAVGNDQDGYPADMPVDKDAVRALLRAKLQLREDEARILEQQEGIILSAFRDGTPPASIARALSEVADEMGIVDRHGLGVTESTVHAVLRPHKRRPATPAT